MRQSRQAYQGRGPLDTSRPPPGPYLGEDIKADLASNGVSETIVCKLLSQDRYHLSTDLGIMIVLFKLIPLLLQER